MGTTQVPKDVAVAIKECWPDGVVEQFATDESYFHDMEPQLQRDLRNIRGASLLWHTEEEEEIGTGWDQGEIDEPPPSDGWQSYHVFFVAPDSEEFHFEDKTTGIEEREDPLAAEAETTYSGEGWIGCAIGICLAAPYAVINLCSYSHYEDGTVSAPDVESFIYADSTNERVDTDHYHREILTPEAFQKIEALGREISSTLAKHGIQVLDQRVLELPIPGLKASEEVFLQEPLRVLDAFFFRGV
jgi:hypothetical protein